MSGKIRKFLDFNIRSVDGEPRTYWFTASTPARDRMGDVIVQEGWKTQDFIKTGGPILWGHDYYSTPIGRGKEVSVSAQKLDIKVEFVPAEIDPFAGKVEQLVANGFLKTGSVGFMAYKTEPLSTEDLAQRPEMKYGQRLFGDLLEFSIVPVPANPEAMAQKDFADVMGRGLGMRPIEEKNKLFPYEDKNGKFNERLLKASIAVLNGARGFKLSESLPEVNLDACLNHLYRVAQENKLYMPSPEVVKKEGVNELFRDVLHDEVLDVLNAIDGEVGETSLKLITGKKRNEILAAYNSLGSLLRMTTVEEEVVAPSQDDEKFSLLSDINKDLSSLKARLT